MLISWMTKEIGKKPKTNGFGSINDGDDCSRNPRRKWLEVSVVTYKAYVILLQFLVIAMNAMVTKLSIDTQEHLVETRSRD